VNPLAYERRDRIGDRNLNRNLSSTKEPKDFEDKVANWLCPLSRSTRSCSTCIRLARDAALRDARPRDNTDALQPFKHSQASGRWRAGSG